MHDFSRLTEIWLLFGGAHLNAYDVVLMAYTKSRATFIRNTFILLSNSFSFIFSRLAVVFWEIQTNGRVPYESASTSLAMEKIIEGELLDVDELWDDDFKQMLLSCWSYKPRKRPKIPAVSNFFAKRARILGNFKHYTIKADSRQITIKRVKS